MLCMPSTKKKRNKTLSPSVSRAMSFGTMASALWWLLAGIRAKTSPHMARLNARMPHGTAAKSASSRS